MARRRIGILGCGKLGKFLVRNLLGETSLRDQFELVFVWSRRASAWQDIVPGHMCLHDLNEFADFEPQVIVEVAHPAVTEAHGERFLQHCDYLIGSPTALADPSLEARLVAAANRVGGAYGLYVPRGALPGLEEVLRLKEDGLLVDVSITMRKHPASLNICGPLGETLAEPFRGEKEVYSGPLRPLCGMAPNNVNTMAVLAMASGVGFDRLQARLVADPTLEHHVTEVCLRGPVSNSPRFSLDLIRKSPAGRGAVSSEATLSAFLASVRAAGGRGPGIHYC